jgi:hypothetical protein
MNLGLFACVHKICNLSLAFVANVHRRASLCSDKSLAGKYLGIWNIAWNRLVVTLVER